MENLVLNIFCSMTVQKNDELRRYKQKTDFGVFTPSSSLFNNSNLRDKISNMLFHC